MAHFCIEIAGRVAQVVSLYDSTRDYCRKYLTEEAPDFTISISREDLAFEQDFAFREAREEGLRPRVFTDPFLERAAIQRAFAEYLFHYDILLFHGSAVAVDGKGYLFTAHSGTGKSTHTRYWMQVFGERAVMINDDKPFLELRADGVWLHGSPWSGKHGLDCNICLPLQGLCVLERGSENHIRQLPSDEALPMLRKQAYQPLITETEPAFSRLVDRLSTAVPLWKMSCIKDPKAAEIAHTAMSE